MTEWNQGRVRVSLKDDDSGGRSLLLTGEARNSAELLVWLRAMGLDGRSMGHLIVANGSVSKTEAGEYAEFGLPCHHQTQADATRHAVHRLSNLFLQLELDSEFGEEETAKGFMPNTGIFERFIFGSGLA